MDCPGVPDGSPPQTPGPYALCHPFPSTSDGPDHLLPDCWHRHGDTYQTSSIYDNIVISPSPTTHIWIWLCSDTCMLHINYKQIIWFGWSLVDLIGTCGILGNFRVKQYFWKVTSVYRRTSRVSKQHGQLYWYHDVWHRLCLIRKPVNKTSYLIWHWFKSYH